MSAKWFENGLMALAFGIGLGMLGASCPSPKDDPTPPAPPVDGTVCERACQRMAELKCPGYDGSPDGTTCVTVCEDTEKSGVARFCPNEVAAIASCDELEAAFEACE